MHGPVRRGPSQNSRVPSSGSTIHAATLFAPSRSAESDGSPSAESESVLRERPRMLKPLQEPVRRLWPADGPRSVPCLPACPARQRLIDALPGRCSHRSRRRGPVSISWSAERHARRYRRAAQRRPHGLRSLTGAPRNGDPSTGDPSTLGGFFEALPQRSASPEHPLRDRGPLWERDPWRSKFGSRGIHLRSCRAVRRVPDR